jgi:hypothetical protein
VVAGAAGVEADGVATDVGLVGFEPPHAATNAAMMTTLAKAE